uniref:AtuA-related protein n=1 Tax=Halomonas sp. TaxID=1486246 RepID=UPI00261A3EC6|nr:hypothetical protein [Halomonas sp.]
MTSMTATTGPRRLHDIAHARAGDKGDRLNLAVFAYDERDYARLVTIVNESRVLEMFAHRGATQVRRYLLPKLSGMNLVIDNVLQGGVNGALNLDGHGKTLSFLLLSMPLVVDDTA